MHMGLISVPEYYLLAALLGVLGQAIRGILGLVKRMRLTGEINFSYRLFVVTLGLGALAGVMGALIYDLAPFSPVTIPTDALWNDRNFILMAISAGYFGADVIEGILGRHAPHRRPKS